MVSRGALGVTILSCGGAPLSQPGDAGPPTWRLVWSDEFSGAAGTSPDSLKWSPDVGDGCEFGNCGTGSAEKQYYTNAPENGSLNGTGQLAIIARRAVSGLRCYYGACQYTSAKLTTRGKMGALPGRVEARIRLPTGQGLWPAFALLGSSFPATPRPWCGELDIMESHGSDPRSIISAMHGPGYFNVNYAGRKYVPESGGTLTDDYHVFAVEWNAERILFFVDGALHFTLARTEVERGGPWVFDRSFFLILSVAVGGSFDGDPVSDAIFPATMLVDYVHVYVRS